MQYGTQLQAMAQQNYWDYYKAAADQYKTSYDYYYNQALEKIKLAMSGDMTPSEFDTFMNSLGSGFASGFGKSLGDKFSGGSTTTPPVGQNTGYENWG